MRTICMLLANPFLSDSRVKRHIDTLLDDGNEVILLCPQKNEIPPAPVEKVVDNYPSGLFLIQRLERPKDIPTSRWGYRRYVIENFLLYGQRMTKDFIEAGMKHSFDLVWANDLVTLEPAYRLARNKGVPLIYDAHEIYLEQYRNVYRASGRLNWKRILLRKLNYYRSAAVERFLIPKVDLFMTVNPLIEDYYRRKYEIKKSRTILNVPKRTLLQKAAISLRAQIGVGDDERIAAYHGVLDRARGVFELAEAAAFLPDDIHIVLIGYGAAKAELARQVDSYPRKNLHLVDTIPYESLISSLKQIDLSVVPIHSKSLSYYLASPNKLFESLLAGVPLLVPDYPFMRKVVEETGMGSVFEDEITASSLASNIRSFFESGSLGRPDYVSPFVWENEEKDFLHVLSEVFYPDGISPEGQADPGRTIGAAKQRLFQTMRKFDRADWSRLVDLLSGADDVIPLRDSISHTRGGLVSLRHDIDHDLENAVRLAELEIELGFRSTFFVLHTDWYFRHRGTAGISRQMVRALEKIAGMGHEIGLHNNAIAAALLTGNDPVEILERELTLLRSCGFDIKGTASHGDRLGRLAGFINSEVFVECARPEMGEAIRTISYEHPTRGPLTARLEPAAMSELGLEYEAYYLSNDLYLSDTGGHWHAEQYRPMGGNAGLNATELAKRFRSDNEYLPPRPSTPLDYSQLAELLGKGANIQVLTHPIWWDLDSSDNKEACYCNEIAPPNV